MSQEIIEGIRTIEREKGIEAGTLVAALEDALLAAYKKTPGAARHATVELDDDGEFRVFALDIPDDLEARLLEEARERAIDELERIEEETGEKQHTLIVDDELDLDWEQVPENLIDRTDATPDAYVDEAKRRNMNPRMLVEFVDGSKTMVEMVALANATGLVPDVPGMHGPSATVEQLHAVFCPRDEGGLLSRKGVVDFTVARGVAPGVFAVAEMRHPRLRERMGDLQLGAGPYYTFFRPYHLTSLEVPLSAAAAVLHGASHMRPLATPVAEVGARAKRDLAPGQKLDAIGEYCYRGFALTRTDAIAQNALPLGLAQGATVTNRIAAGDYLTYANCAPDEKLEIVKIRHAQDDYVRMAAAA